uniref:Protein shifted n=2 Tax=Cacopsylla melanoneura TaxID=428564 RepID=A0A8D8V4V3_9HEMI
MRFSTQRLPRKDAILNLMEMMWRQQCLLVVCAVTVCCLRTEKDYRKTAGNSAINQQQDKDDLSLWIDEQQVKMYSGFSMEIYAIANGTVLPYILSPEFEHQLPIIPSEMGYVNFTWKSGMKKYYYNFDRLQSFNENILEPPNVSIKTQGRIPRRPKVFSIQLKCSGNGSGIASFTIGLLIISRKGKPLPGTPLRLKLRKECAERSPGPGCDQKCSNGGWCDANQMCQCPKGYQGTYCGTAMCFPQCLNNGTCTAPGVCSCPPGFQGLHCEGGICTEKCLNGGKCVQKDTCECQKGFYGLRCEFSKCIIPCLNGGRCKGVNKCRCPPGFLGDYCEIWQRPYKCPKPCTHGVCSANRVCACYDGWFGRTCSQRSDSGEDRSTLYQGDQEPSTRTKPRRRKVFV